MGKIWLITGSSRGLGLAIVEAALSAGDSVVATARKPEQLDHLVEEYGPARVLSVEMDVTNEKEVHGVVDAAIVKFGRLDVVVNNAGYADVTSVEDMPMDSFRAQFETNFFGAVNVTKTVIPILRRQGSGHIIQVSSVGGRGSSPGLSSYQSAKWALTNFSMVLAQETAPLGVKVTVVEPGGMKTDWAGSSMTDLPLSDHYQQTVGALKEMRDSMKDSWTAPERCADGILRLTRSDDPPIRVLLSTQAAEVAEQFRAQLASSDQKWHEFTLSCS